MKYIKPIKPSHAQGRLKEIYDDIQHVFPGKGPIAAPYVAHSLAVDFLDQHWQTAKATYFSGTFTREYKDVIAGAVSVANQCPYCVEAHSNLVKFTDQEVALAIQTKNSGHIHNAELRNLVEWGFATLSPTSEIIKNPPFNATDRAEIVGTALNFHYINRFINVFLEDSVIPIPNVMGVKSLLMFMGKPILQELSHLKLNDGKALRSTPNGALPHDMRWAESNPIVATAFLRLAKAADRAGEEELPADVRVVVAEKINAWRGESMPLGKQWLETATAPLVDEMKPLARLALMTALASYRVDQETIAAFKHVLPGDASLVKAVIWASFQAARRIGSWL